MSVWPIENNGVQYFPLACFFSILLPSFTQLVKYVAFYALFCVIFSSIWSLLLSSLFVRFAILFSFVLERVCVYVQWTLFIGIERDWKKESTDFNSVVPLFLCVTTTAYTSFSKFRPYSEPIWIMSWYGFLSQSSSMRKTD